MYQLIDLPYAPDALEPVISARTLEFHHGKHLKGYVDNLNKLIAGTEFETMPLEEIVCKASGALFNNAGQTLNHNLYFTQFSGRHHRLEAASQLGKQLIAQWGSPEAFQEEFAAKGAGLFGSGWVWLAAAPDGTLSILQCPGADNPVTKGLKP
ncbi:MAG: superoxide dismutase, partial [Bacteroidales bacterium]|nr:superoxide dismutase [Bacteroidales bacterium]